MSGIPLSKNQIKLLSKGLKFTPIPRPNIPETKRDTEDFTRKLSLRDFFADENNSNENSQNSSDSLVKNKGKLNPPRNRNKVLDTVIDFLRKQNFEETNQINKRNISKHERKGLMELKNNKNIIIKEADKGGKVVIMSTKHYCKMIYDHLNNNQIFEKTDNICGNKVMNKIKKNNSEVLKKITQKY